MRKMEVDRYMRRESAKGLSRPARAVYRVLLVCAKADTGDLRFERIGDKRFRDETGYGRTSVKAARKELVGAGLLEVVEVGHARNRSSYRIVTGPTQLEREITDAQVAEYAARLAEADAAAMASAAASDPGRVKERPGEGQNLTPPTRAHPGLPGSDRPYPPGQGPATSEAAALRATEGLSPVASGAGAARCPVAASRGKPCGSCRACGTNPRALRKRAAAERGVTRVPELFRAAPPPDERIATNQAGIELVRAQLAARYGPKEGRCAPGQDDRATAPPAAPSPAGRGS